jgi:hypothetical protein
VTGVAAEAELALLLAGTRARRVGASARIAQLAAVVDEMDFAGFLVDQRMLLLAGTRLFEVAPTALSDDFRRRLRAAHDEARAGALLFAAAGDHLRDALEKDGIPAVELKGAALAEDLHGEFALRSFADIDLLVSVDNLDRAVTIANRLGWDTPADSADPGLPQLHRWLSSASQSLPIVELHWRVHWYETAFASGALARSRVLDGARRLHPIDQLAALLLFYARDGFAGLRLAADIGAWWDRYGEATVPGGLQRLMSQHPALKEPWRAALAAAAPVAGLPCSAVRGVAGPFGRRSALAIRLRNWDFRGDTDQIHANVTLVDGLLAPPEDLRGFVARHVLVSRRFLSETYGVSMHDSWHLLRWRVWHAVKTVTRYGLALWGIRRGRWWSPVPVSAQALAEQP